MERSYPSRRWEVKLKSLGGGWIIAPSAFGRIALLRSLAKENADALSFGYAHYATQRPCASELARSLVQIQPPDKPN